MTAIMVTYLLLRRHTIYLKQVRSPLESPAHFGDFTVDGRLGEHARQVVHRRLAR